MRAVLPWQRIRRAALAASHAAHRRKAAGAPRWHRVARIAAVTLLSLAVSYLLIANILIATALPRMMSSERTHIAWRSGYSIVPMRVHLRRVEIEIAGEQAVWRVEAGRVDTWIGPFAFLGGALHASSTHADEVTIRARDTVQERHEPDSASPTTEPGPPPPAPPIALGRPLATAGEAPVAKAEGREFRFDDLEATSVREVTIGKLSYRGDATARLTVDGREGGALRIAHGTIDSETGKLLVSGKELLREIRGWLTINRSEIDSDAPAGNAWLGLVDGGVEVEATAIGAGGLARAGAPSASNGRMRASMRFENGALAKQSTASLHVPALTSPEPAAPSFAADAAFQVDDAGHATLTARLREVALAEISPLSLATSASDLRVEARWPSVRVAAPTAGASMTVDVKGLCLDVARVPLLDGLVHADACGLQGDGRLVAEETRASGSLSARGSAVELTLPTLRRRGTLEVALELRSWPRGAEDAVVTLHAEHAAVIDGRREAAKLDVEDAVVHLEDPPRVAGRATLSMSDATPALDALLGGPSHVPPLARTIASVTPLVGTAIARLDRDGLSLRDIHATAGLLSVRGVASVPASGPRTATLLFEAGPFASGVSIEREQTTFILIDAERWFEESLATQP